MTKASRNKQEEQFCWQILPRVSRTFAVSIRVLPRHHRTAVMASYLLCRIADTIEDDRQLTALRKLALLQAFDDLLCGRLSAQAFTDAVQGLTGDPQHVRLVRHADKVLAVWQSLSVEQRAITRKWIREMIGGMTEFIRRYPDGIRLQTTGEFSRYCYYVAGTIGFLLTDLWTEGYRANLHLRPYLIMLAENFGRGLQSVNILRDVVADARVENAIYLPAERLRSQGSSHAQLLDTQFATATGATISAMAGDARDDLQDALAFTQTLPRQWWRIRFFCAFPLFLALASLRAVEDTTFDPNTIRGPKIDRRDVRRLIWLTAFAISSNRSLAALASGLAGQPWQGAPRWLTNVFTRLYGKGRDRWPSPLANGMV